MLYFKRILETRIKFILNKIMFNLRYVNDITHQNYYNMSEKSFNKISLKITTIIINLLYAATVFFNYFFLLDIKI